MKKLLCLVLFFMSQPAVAEQLSLPYYQRPDGAITVRLHGDRVDPYFAAKALLAAREAKIKADEAALAWIRWAMPLQRADGSFDRFRLQDGEYFPYARADADDATLALWMELLVTFAPSDALPSRWERSFSKASRNLERLRDKRTGVYQISKTIPVALLMDNVEVYSALKAAAKYYARAGKPLKGKKFDGQAKKLKKSIISVFWQSGRGFRASTQDRSGNDFYPDQVAQLFPLLEGIESPEGSNQLVYASWMTKYRKSWVQQASLDFPWGIVALAADKMGDVKTVECWRALSAPFRHGKNWNVLEEALYTAFEGRTGTKRSVPICTNFE